MEQHNRADENNYFEASGFIPDFGLSKKPRNLRWENHDLGTDNRFQLFGLKIYF
jgi:hypothetical protein